MLPALLRNYFGPTAGAGQKAVEPRTSSRMRFRISNPDASSDDGDDDDDDYDGDDHDNDDASSTVSYAAPVYRLPPQALVRIFGYLVEAGRSASGGGFNGSDGADEGSGYGYGSSNASAAKTVTKTSLVAVLLACRPWLESGIPALYANPPLHTAHAFAGLVRVLAQSAAPDSATYFEYHPLVEALDISGE
ncbi:hypothetical protein HK100_012411 [Physocladia obscura]|uniref:Uncharacterized protein n=1 Tax=Physocladia obscura TaxID=109957 RepID=A0AAD5T2D8_9FUNG|nr:hypothetical protein HK100_012411 [Physocladia obscura]